MKELLAEVRERRLLLVGGPHQGNELRTARALEERGLIYLRARPDGPGYEAIPRQPDTPAPGGRAVVP